MNNLIIKSPQQTIISMSLLKYHLRIAHDLEDTYLSNIINIATEILENELNESFLIKTFKYTHFNDVKSNNIKIPINNIQSIISVKMAPKNIDLPYTTILYTNTIMTNITYIDSPIEIIYSAGLTNYVDQIPKNFKLAVLQIAKSIYENSEENILESKFIKNLIQSHKSLHL